MNNKTIILGTVNMDWHFARGRYSCTCAITEDTNAFDRVICGILYRNHGYMLKSKIATIMGFNVVDKPFENRYSDRSEKAIFDNAVATLVDYGLVIDDTSTNELILTESGNHSFETRTKQRIEDKEVELWTDEFSGIRFHNSILNGMAVHSEDYSINPDWNALVSSPMEALNVQKSELVDYNAGKSVTSIRCISMDYYVANIECIVCYDIDNQHIFACSASSSIEIDKILSRDELQTQLLEKFFENKVASIIYKQPYQEKVEDFIRDQEPEEISHFNIITCKENFLSKLNNHLQEENVPIVYFSIPKLTNTIKEFLKGLSCDIICVDFVDGDINDTEIGMGNVCYYHVDEPRTLDLCVYDKTFYSLLPYIIDYKGVSYSLQLIYKNEGEKYNYSVLYAPFINYILDRALTIGKNGLIDLQKSSSPKIVNNVLKLCIEISKINLLYCNSDVIDKAKELGETAQKMIVSWINSLHDRLSNLEAEIGAGQEQDLSLALLKQIEVDANASIQDEDVLAHISEVRELLNKSRVTGPKIELQTVYILDTSIFMNMPNILDKFDLLHDKIVVPRSMEQEIDGKAHDLDPEKKEKAIKARLYLRRKREDYPQFVTIKNNVDRNLLPVGFDPAKKDNDMLATAIELEKDNNYGKIIVVTDDKVLLLNILECVKSNIISNRIEAIDLDELLVRLSE